MTKFSSNHYIYDNVAGDLKWTDSYWSTYSPYAKKRCEKLDDTDFVFLFEIRWVRPCIVNKISFGLKDLQIYEMIL